MSHGAGAPCSACRCGSRARPRWGAAAWPALAAPALSGCFAAVLHGPEVERGVVGGLTGMVASGPTYTEGDAGGIRLRNPPVGLSLGHGWAAPTRRSPGVFVGAHVPVLFPAAQLDLYVQVPRAWTGASAGGVGVNVDLERVHPYAQWGRVDARGSGWYLLQGVSVRQRDQFETRSVAWVPGVGTQFGHPRATVHLFALAAFGRIPGRCLPYAVERGCVPGARSHALSAGATVLAHRARRPR